ncbi:CynX/NimT family MFS transporter [Zafaria sp. Z1313]|uniref:MFS transporter n=1 Tax=Zafaria sp. Z1313 TaxID=3423202 RepID=UPI003D302370
MTDRTIPATPHRVSPPPRPSALRGSRTWMVAAAVVFAALNARTVIAAVSPVAAEVDAELGLGTLGFGILGALPPIVRRNFRNRIGTATSLYVVAMSLGTGGPALLGVPVTDAAGWRASLAVWAVAAAAAAVLWFGAVLFPRRRRPLTGPEPKAASGRQSGPVVVPGPVWRSPTAWAIAALFALAATHAYAAMAWLPLIMAETAGASRAGAGGLLALFGMIGILPSLTAPGLAAHRVRLRSYLIAALALMASGYAGLIAAPGAAPLVWTACIGTGSAFFPLCLALVNFRTRTAEGTVALSGFVQAFGYGAGALGPLVVGVLREATGTWTLPLALLLGSTVVVAASAWVLERGACLEDETTPATGRAAPPSGRSPTPGPR